MKKRLLSLLLTLCMVLTLLPGTAVAADAEADSGTCGNNLTWVLSNGVLTISGTGAMTDYSYYDNYAPWYGKDCSEVIIESGITRIGTYAFYACSATKITLPSGITSIPEGAFHSSKFTHITIPEGVSYIGGLAFSGCNITSISLPSTLTSVANQAFVLTSLKDVYYAGSQADWEKVSIGSQGGYNDSLTKATIHYNSTGPDTSEPGPDIPTDNYISSVYFLSSWDASTRQVKFGNPEGISPNTYTVADGVDVSGINSLLNRYVLVTMKQNGSSLDYIITDIQSVESKVGTVSATGEHSLTIDGTVYPVQENLMLWTSDGRKILYHVFDGTIAYFSEIETKTGLWEKYDPTTQVVTVDGVNYRTNFLTSMDFASNTDWIGWSVSADIVDGFVLSITMVPGSTKTVYKKFDNYNAANRLVSFSDGSSFTVADDVTLDFSGLDDHYVCCTITNTSQGIRLSNISKVTPTATISVAIEISAIEWDNGKMRAKGSNDEYQSRADFEIPISVTIQNTTNVPGFTQAELSSDSSLTVTLSGLKVEAPDGFNFGWFGGGTVGFDTPNNVLKPGESITSNKGWIKAGTFFEPASTNNTYKVIAIINMDEEILSGSKEFTIEDVNVTASDELPEEIQELFDKANQELRKAKLPFALRRDVMKDIFGISGNALTSFQQELYTIFVMSKIPEKTLQEKIDTKVLTKLFGKWKPDVSADQWVLPLVYEFETGSPYGRVTVKIELKINAYSYVDSNFGRTASVYYEILSSEAPIPAHLQSGLLGGGTYYDMDAFASAVYSLVEGELKSAYDTAWGNSANELADWLFDDNVKKILKAEKTTFKDVVWKLYTWPTKSVVNRCPTNVYIYNEKNELCGSIENDVVTRSCEDFELYAENGVKYIIGLEDQYTVKYVATADGTMDVIVVENVDTKTPLRQIQHLNIPLTVDGYYSQNITDKIKPSIVEYQLVSNENKIILPNGETSLIELEPAEEETNARDGFVIIFDANGGAISPATVVTDADGKLTTQLPTITRDNYIFNGWYSAPSGGNKVTDDTVFDSDTILYAQWTANNGNGSSSSPGGSPTPGNPSYQITVSSSSNGTVSITPTSAKSGDKVTITATPDSGYKVGSVTVRDASGNTVAVTSLGNNQYSFTMPSGKVTVDVTFVPIQESWTNLFTDVSESDWFHDGVAYVAQNGLMQGVGGGQFNPGGTTSRGMIATILYRLEGEPAVSQSSFTDVAAGQYYTDAVAWAAANKIVEGYGNNTFGPNDDITREQMATILYRYADYKGYDVNGLADLSSYTDQKKISSWALVAMRWANRKGLITGRTTITLVPKGTTTRAEAAVVLSRFCRDVAGLE